MREDYLRQILQAARNFHNAHDNPHLAATHKEALARLSQQAPPAKKSEAFHHSELLALLQEHISYGSSVCPDRLPPPRECNANAMARTKEESHTFAFRDGWQVSGSFRAPTEGKKINLQNLKAGAKDNLALRLPNFPSVPEQFFPTVNALFLEAGSVLSVPVGMVIRHPIFLFYETHKPTAHLRHLIRMERGSQATFIAYHTCPPALTTVHENVVCRIVCEEGSTLDYCKIQNDEGPMLRVDSTIATQAKDSCLHLNTFTLNTLHTRNQLYVQSEGNNTQTTLNGLYVLKGKAQADNHLRVEHQMPHTTSQQLYKGILRDAAQSAFEGVIHIFPDAQKTKAYQTNNNILLCPTATCHSKPRLEIYADDVKCSHGCTSNFLDPHMTFYMQSRGIKEECAHRMLLTLFANEVIEKTKETALRDDLHNLVARHLDA